MADKKFLQELTSFCQQRGLFWGPEPEIYGGLAGFYTFGPLGKLLKNRVENSIRKTFQKYGFWEVECPTVMPKEVWEASGHLGGFSDPIIICSKCKAMFRVDSLIEEHEPDYKGADYLDKIKELKLKCPSCKSDFTMEIKRHNLMMKTTIGLDKEAYNRPETATTTYLPFPRYADYFRKKLPFAVFQIGKAYRNEISPRQYLFRMREFTQAEAQIFLFKDQKDEFEQYDDVKNEKLPLLPSSAQEKTHEPISISVEEACKKKHFKNKAYAFAVFLAYNQFRNLGILERNIRLRQHKDDEKAFYADDAWDIEIKFQSFGWLEVCGIHDRTDYDLTQHAKFSGAKLELMNEKTQKKEAPQVIEIAFGSDRPTFAIVDNFYDKKLIDEGKTMFKLPYHIAPIQAAVFPLMKKPELTAIAKKIFEDLMVDSVCEYDDSGSIGKRYLRAAEKGIPFCITIDYQTVEDNTVTIRDRDTEKQIRIKIAGLKDILKGLLNGEKLEKHGSIIKGNASAE
ncbi:MAG: glycine--tRNA ligase [Candidatus Woesearchaeota archaeon]